MHVEDNKAHDPVDHRAFSYYEQLGKVKRYVEEHFEEPEIISAGQLARVAGMDRSYFSQFFRKKVGIRFQDWLNELRVRKAEDLIRSRDYTMGEVAMAAGFGSFRTFNRAFRRYRQMSPSELKRRACPA